MPIKNSLLAGLASLVVTAPSHPQAPPAAQITAPYGYVWGQAQTTTKNLTECYHPPPDLTLCKTWAPPRPRDNAKHYWLLFTPTAGLISVVYISHNITGDGHGTEGRRQFEKIAVDFKGEYPQATHEKITWKSNFLTKHPEKFYECLQKPECAQYTLHVRTPQQGQAGVMLQGTAHGQGHLFVMHEAPNYAAARQQRE